jgi:hypothetical protein
MFVRVHCRASVSSLRASTAAAISASRIADPSSHGASRTGGSTLPVPDVQRRAKRGAVVAAAGWMYTSVNGVSARTLPLATLFIAHPPARHSLGLATRACNARRI